MRTGTYAVIVRQIQDSLAGISGVQVHVSWASATSTQLASWRQLWARLLAGGSAAPGGSPGNGA
jgi:hypothetical protein